MGINSNLKPSFYILTYLIFMYRIPIYPAGKEDIYCYSIEYNNGIPDIAADPPPKGKSIFFHETSCTNRSDYYISITTRQACAVESAAMLHPNQRVYLLYNSPIQYPNASDNSQESRLIRELLKYKNFRIRRVNINEYVKGTPLDNWGIIPKLEKSVYSISHASDILRYLTLWKYGGTYLDLDVVVIKDLAQLGYNFAAREDPTTVSSGVLNFDPENFGHTLARDCLNEIRYTPMEYEWTSYGPDIITKVLRNVCEKRPMVMLSKKICQGFQLFRRSAFYPIEYYNWDEYFDNSTISFVLKKIEKSYTIHLWNKLSSGMNVSTGDYTPAYGVIASTFCPNVFRESGTMF